MRRIIGIAAALLLLVTACGGSSSSDTTEVASTQAAVTSSTAPATITQPAITTSSTTTTRSDPEPGAVFAGPFEDSAGLTGTISFEIAAAGGQIVTMTAAFDADEYRCNGSIVSGGFATTIEPAAPIPIADGSFELGWDTLSWDGSFDSETTAEGSFWMLDQGCEYGPMGWEASSS